MRYIIVLGDGMADRPVPELSGKTPLEAAYKPNMDRLCGEGRLGRMRTLYDDLPLGSDVANLSVLGFDPHLYYTGRSPIEALGLHIPLTDDDVVFRMNLVTLSDGGEFADKTMLDHSSDKITTEEAAELVAALSAEFQSERVRLYPGVSYRHVFVLKKPDYRGELAAPHDILGQKIGAHLPKGDLAGELLAMMEKSYELLSAHPVNRARVERGLRPANCLWLWGQGKKPSFMRFCDVYRVKNGVAITAVPLIKGLAIGLGLDTREVPGATGDYDTNYQGKGRAAADALREGYEFVFIHIEAPDECGHDGNAELKKSAIEKIDEYIVGPVRKAAESFGEPFKLVVAPDHATPVSVRTHTAEPVPFILYDNRVRGSGIPSYCEKAAEHSTLFFEDAYRLMGALIEK